MSALALAVRPFDFEGHPFRVVLQDDEPWFVAADVCGALGIKNNRDAVASLDADEKGVGLTDTPGGVQQVAIVSESGLWTIVLRSRDAVKAGTVAHRFRKWVTCEVIPAIRKTGSYGAPANDVAALQQIVTQQVREIQDLRRMVEGMAEKAQAFDRMLGRQGAITRAARTLNHLASVGAVQPFETRATPLLLPGPGRQLHPSEQAVLNALRHAASGNEATLTNKDLQEITALSRRAVNYALRTLSQLGYISRHFEPGMPPVTWLHLPR